MTIVSLREIPGGQVHVAYLVGHPDYMHRLEEIGIMPGKLLQIVRPGKSCIIQVDGNRLCFRPSRLLDIMVQVL